MRYAVAIVATKIGPDGSRTDVLRTAVVAAGTYDEAYGKACRIMHAAFPPRAGWRRHAVGVQSCEIVDTPEATAEFHVG